MNKILYLIQNRDEVTRKMKLQYAIVMYNAFLQLKYPQ